MATPWPDKPCPYCQQIITDLLVEMVPDTDQGTADHQAINNRKPGGAVTCPYCQEAIAYDVKGEDLVKSGRIPLRYSRLKTEDRAKNYGQVFFEPAQYNTRGVGGARQRNAWCFSWIQVRGGPMK